MQRRAAASCWELRSPPRSAASNSAWILCPRAAGAPSAARRSIQRCLLLLPVPGQGERPEVVRHRHPRAERPVHPGPHLGAAARMGNAALRLAAVRSVRFGAAPSAPPLRHRRDVGRPEVMWGGRRSGGSVGPGRALGVCGPERGMNATRHLWGPGRTLGRGGEWPRGGRRRGRRGRGSKSSRRGGGRPRGGPSARQRSEPQPGVGGAPSPEGPRLWVAPSCWWGPCWQPR